MGNRKYHIEECGFYSTGNRKSLFFSKGVKKKMICWKNEFKELYRKDQSEKKGKKLARCIRQLL